MKVVLDRVAIRNERLKALASTFHNLGLGIIGYSILRPAIEMKGAVDKASPVWFIIGLVLIVVQHYILGWIAKLEAQDDAA